MHVKCSHEKQKEKRKSWIHREKWRLRCCKADDGWVFWWFLYSILRQIWANAIIKSAEVLMPEEIIQCFFHYSNCNQFNKLPHAKEKESNWIAYETASVDQLWIPRKIIKLGKWKKAHFAGKRWHCRWKNENFSPPKYTHFVTLSTIEEEEVGTFVSRWVIEVISTCKLKLRGLGLSIWRIIYSSQVTWVRLLCQSNMLHLWADEKGASVNNLQAKTRAK